MEGPEEPLDEGAAVCVLAPQVGSDAGGRASALVPIGRPTIFAAGRFAEIRIERQGLVLWHRQAVADQPLEGPIPWPLPPIRPGESLLLRLRPVAAAANDAAVIGLIGAAAAVMHRGDALLASLGDDAGAWIEAVRQQLDAGDTSMAAALLFAHEGPGEPQLNRLRLEVMRQSCLLRDPPGRFAPLTSPPAGKQPG